MISVVRLLVKCINEIETQIVYPHKIIIGISENSILWLFSDKTGN